MNHEWRYVQFVFSSWTECSCGFEPKDEDEFNAHTQQYMNPDPEYVI